jgi:hypothetical protein
MCLDGVDDARKVEVEFGIGFLDFGEREFDYRITAIGLFIWLGHGRVGVVALDTYLICTSWVGIAKMSSLGVSGGHCILVP